MPYLRIVIMVNPGNVRRLSVRYDFEPAYAPLYGFIRDLHAVFLLQMFKVLVLEFF